MTWSFSSKFRTLWLWLQCIFTWISSCILILKWTIQNPWSFISLFSLSLTLSPHLRVFSKYLYFFMPLISMSICNFVAWYSLFLSLRLRRFSWLLNLTIKVWDGIGRFWYLQIAILWRISKRYIDKLSFTNFLELDWWWLHRSRSSYLMRFRGKSVKYCIRLNWMRRIECKRWMCKRKVELFQHANNNCLIRLYIIDYHFVTCEKKPVREHSKPNARFRQSNISHLLSTLNETLPAKFWFLPQRFVSMFVCYLQNWAQVDIVWFQ